MGGAAASGAVVIVVRAAARCRVAPIRMGNVKYRLGAWASQHPSARGMHLLQSADCCCLPQMTYPHRSHVAVIFRRRCCSRRNPRVFADDTLADFCPACRSPSTKVPLPTKEFMPSCGRDVLKIPQHLGSACLLPRSCRDMTVSIVALPA